MPTVMTFPRRNSYAFSVWTFRCQFGPCVKTEIMQRKRLLWHPEQFPDACCCCWGSCSCSCCCRLLLADAWTWSPAACRCELTAEPKVTEHRPLLSFTLYIFSIHVRASQRETMLCSHCFAERFRSQICDVFFAPDSAHSQSLGSDLVLYPQVRHLNVLQLPDFMPVENVLSGFGVSGQHWFHCKAQVTHHALDTLRF